MKGGVYDRAEERFCFAPAGLKKNVLEILVDCRISTICHQCRRPPIDQFVVDHFHYPHMQQK